MFQSTAFSVPASDSFRHGFQGQEEDDEIKGNGNSVNYQYRIHDPRLGRFLTIDHLQASFPWNSPYCFAENDVIRSIDLDGLEKIVCTVTSEPNTTSGVPGSASITISKHYEVITEGVSSVTDVHHISPEQFSNLYNKGDGKIFLSQLPTASGQKAIALSGRRLTWAQTANNTSETEEKRAKFANKLKEDGASYYIANVDYQFTMGISDNCTLDDGLSEIETDAKYSGIVVLYTTPRELVSDGPKSNTYVDFQELNNSARRTFIKSPKSGGASPVDAIDVIFLNPISWADNSLYDVKGEEYDDAHVLQYFTFYSRNEAIAHEAGHNCTGIGHDVPEGQYEVPGLLSNRAGKVSPTTENTIQILNHGDKSSGF